jgi:hypothetical protein
MIDYDKGPDKLASQPAGAAGQPAAPKLFRGAPSYECVVGEAIQRRSTERGSSFSLSTNAFAAM